MKKLILSLFLSIIGFIGFSSAYTFGDLQNLSCNGGRCGVVSVNSDVLGMFIEGGNFCNDGFVNIDLSNGGTKYIYPLTIGEHLFDYDSSVIYITLFCGVGNGDVSFKFIYPDLPVVEGGSSNITPVITGLFSVYGELIPYVVYIGIGILLVTIGFYAIRRLVNWLSDKIHNNFKF